MWRTVLPWRVGADAQDDERDAVKPVMFEYRCWYLGRHVIQALIASFHGLRDGSVNV
jgi:hypothetical protein